MAINKKLIHFSTFENFNSKKLSANAENTLYTVGINGSVQTGSPDILYQSIVYIKDTKQQWTHGLLYNCSDSENLLKTYTFYYEGNHLEYTITQEELEKIQNADIVYLSNGTNNIQLTLKLESSYIYFLGYDLNNYPHSIKLTGVTIAELKVIIGLDDIGILDYISDYINEDSAPYAAAVCEEMVDGALIEVVENQEKLYDVATSPKPLILLLSDYNLGNLYSLFGPYYIFNQGTLLIKFIGEYNDLIIECVVNSNDGFLYGTLHIKSEGDLSNYPTKTSDLENDSGFITINDIPEVTVPTKVSELTNDSGFITINDVPVLEIPEEYVTETELNNKGFLTEHQDISHLATKLEIPSIAGLVKEEDLPDFNTFVKTSDIPKLATVATTGSYNDLANKPEIPNETTISNWGFTKNTGTYVKPDAGIPETDLNTSVQQALNKANTALQSYTEQYTGTVTSIKMNDSMKDPVNGVVDLGTVITSHQDISGKQDKLVSGTNIKTINGTSILGGGDIVISGGGGSSDANVQAVDTTETLDDVETNTYVKYVAQTLTEEQKAQVRENIGVNSSNDTTNLIDYVKKEELSEVAMSGSYNDLLDKPTQITKPILEATLLGDVAGFTGNDVMKHSVIYVSLADNTCTTVTIENFEAPDKDVVEYVWHFKTGTMPTLSLPSYIYWANGELPEIEDDTVYELSITATRHYPTLDYIYKAILVPFKTI